MAAGITHLTDQTFDEEIRSSDAPVLVDFWAEWCGPCKMIAPTLEEIGKDYAGRLKIAKLNVDENHGVAGKYGVHSIPTLMIFKGGKNVAARIGAGPKSELSRWICATV